MLRSTQISGPKIYQEVDRMVRFWMTKAEADLPWDVTADIDSVISDMMFSVVFGKHVDRGHSDNVRTFIILP